MDDTPVAWSKLEFHGVPVSKRSGHSLTNVGSSKGYLFGGIDLKTPPGPNNDLYSFELFPTGACSCARIVCSRSRRAQPSLTAASPFATFFPPHDRD